MDWFTECNTAIDPAELRELAELEHATARRATRMRRQASEDVVTAFWRPGRTLNLYLTGNVEEPTLRAILDTASTWLAYANLRFHRVTELELEGWEQTADGHLVDCITVVAKPGTLSSSPLGIHALLPGATVYIGVEPSDPEFTLTVLHEFGHLLGMCHEHQHPDADIQWNKPVLYEFFAQHVHAEEVDSNCFTKYDHAWFPDKPYDPLSVMHYPIPASWTLDNREYPANSRLSEHDKALMERVYPR